MAISLINRNTLNRQKKREDEDEARLRREDAINAIRGTETNTARNNAPSLNAGAKLDMSAVRQRREERERQQQENFRNDFGDALARDEVRRNPGPILRSVMDATRGAPEGARSGADDLREQQTRRQFEEEWDISSGMPVRRAQPAPRGRGGDLEQNQLDLNAVFSAAREKIEGARTSASDLRDQLQQFQFEREWDTSSGVPVRRTQPQPVSAAEQALLDLDRVTASAQQTQTDRTRNAQDMDEANRQLFDVAKSVAINYGVDWVTNDLEYSQENLDRLLNTNGIGENVRVQQARWETNRMQGISEAIDERSVNESTESERLRNIAQQDPQLWANYQRFNENAWAGTLINPMDVDTSEVKDLQLMLQIRMNSRDEDNRLNGEQMRTATRTMERLAQQLMLKNDPDQAIEQIRGEIAALEDLKENGGAYFAAHSGDIDERIRTLEDQIVLAEAGKLDQNTDYAEKAAHGEKAILAGMDMAEYMALTAQRYSRTPDELRAGFENEDEWNYSLANATLTGHADVGGIQLNLFRVGLSEDPAAQIEMMRETERERYYYLSATDPEAAEQYREAMLPILQERFLDAEKAIQQRSATQNAVAAVGSAVGAVVSEVMKPAESLAMTIEGFLTGSDAYDPTGSEAYYWRSQENVQEAQRKFLKEKSQFGAFAYDLGMNVAENLLRSRATYALGITNPAASTAVMAYGAGGQTYMKLREEGVDETTAMIMAGTDAFWEYITEKWSDENLFHGIENGFTGVKNLMKSATESAVMESWTEGANDILGWVTDYIVNGDESEYEQLVKDYLFYTDNEDQAREMAIKQLGMEALYTMALSAASGGMMDIGNRSLTNVARYMSRQKLDELQAEAQQADRAANSYGTQEAAEAAAEIGGEVEGVDGSGFIPETMDEGTRAAFDEVGAMLAENIGEGTEEPERSATEAAAAEVVTGRTLQDVRERPQAVMGEDVRTTPANQEETAEETDNAVMAEAVQAEMQERGLETEETGGENDGRIWLRRPGSSSDTLPNPMPETLTRDERIQRLQTEINEYVEEAAGTKRLSPRKRAQITQDLMERNPAFARLYEEYQQVVNGPEETAQDETGEEEGVIWLRRPTIRETGETRQQRANEASIEETGETRERRENQVELEETGEPRQQRANEASIEETGETRERRENQVELEETGETRQQRANEASIEETGGTRERRENQAELEETGEPRQQRANEASIEETGGTWEHRENQVELEETGEPRQQRTNETSIEETGAPRERRGTNADISEIEREGGHGGGTEATIEETGTRRSNQANIEETGAPRERTGGTEAAIEETGTRRGTTAAIEETGAPEERGGGTEASIEETGTRRGTTASIEETGEYTPEQQQRREFFRAYRVAENDGTAGRGGLGDDEVETVARIREASLKDNTTGTTDESQFFKGAEALWTGIKERYGEIVRKGSEWLQGVREDLAGAGARFVERLQELGINDPRISDLSTQEQRGILDGAIAIAEQMRKQRERTAAAEAAKYGFRSAVLTGMENDEDTGVVIRELDKELTGEEVMQLKMLAEFNQQLQQRGLRGFRVNVYQSLTSQGRALNGSYTNDGRTTTDAATINISREADEGNLLRAAGHELYHSIETWSPTRARELRGYVLNALERTEGYDLEARRAELRQQYTEGTDVDAEIVADSMFEVLSGEELIQQTIARNRSLGTRIRDMVTRISGAFRMMVRNIAGQGSKEARALINQSDVLNRISELWNRGLEDALQNQNLMRIAENDPEMKAVIGSVVNASTVNERAQALQSMGLALSGLIEGTEDADLNEIKTRLDAAARAYGNGEMSLAAAMQEQGLGKLTSKNAGAVVAWYGRELVRGADQMVPDVSTSIRITQKTPEEIAAMATEDSQGETAAYEAMRVLYNKMHDGSSKVNKGAWKKRLAQIVSEEITSRISTDISRKSLSTMVSNVFNALDNDYANIDGVYQYLTDMVDRIAENAKAKNELLSDEEIALLGQLNGKTVELAEGYVLSQAGGGKIIPQLSMKYRKLGIAFTYDKHDASGNRVELKRKGTPVSELITREDLGVIGLKPNGKYGAAEISKALVNWLQGVKYRQGARVTTGNSVEQIADELPQRLIMAYFEQPDLVSTGSTDLSQVVQMYDERIRQLQDQRKADYESFQKIMNEKLNGRAEWENNYKKFWEDKMKARDKAREDRQKMKQYRESIYSNVNKLSQRLLRPTKNKHLLEHLRTGVAKALLLVNTSDPRHPQSLKSVDWSEINAQIREAMKEVGEGIVIDRTIAAYVEQLAATANGKPLLMMTLEETKMVDETLQHIYSVIRDENEFRTRLGTANTLQISDVMDPTIAEMSGKKNAKINSNRKQRAIDFLNIQMADPQRIFDVLARHGGRGFELMFRALREGGLNTQINLTEEGKKIWAEAIGKFDYGKWTGDRQEVFTFNLESGQQVEMTTAGLMELYVLQQRQVGRNHIFGTDIYHQTGGIVIKHQETGRGLKKKVTEGQEVVKVTEDDVDNMIGALTQEQKECADAVAKILSGWGGDIGNKASMAMYGYRKFKENNYFPVHVWSDNFGVKGTELEQSYVAENLYAIVNKGFTKDLIEKANAPLVIGNMFDDALDHIAGMITYASWGPALMDVTRMVNYKTEHDSLMAQLNRTMGKQYGEYIVKLLRDINGLASDQTEAKAKAFSRMFRNFKAAAVGWKLSTIAKQGLSIVRAFDVIPAHYFMSTGAITERFAKDAEGGRKIDALMEKYAPIYSWKQDGRFTMDTGKDLKQLLMPKTMSKMDRITETSMKGAGAADDMTWRSIWIAAEKMIQATQKDLKTGTDEYYKAVGKKFTECIDKTQVVDSILHRTEIMRSNSMWIKMGTSFMGEPLKTWNMAVDALRQYRQNPSKVTSQKLVRTGIILAASAALQATVNAAISALRHWGDDEPLEETFRKYLLGDYEDKDNVYEKAIEAVFGNSIAGEFNPINYIPFLRDISDMVQGYDVTRDDMQLASSLLEAVKAVITDDGKESQAKKWATLAGYIGDMLGVPTSSIVQEMGYVSNYGARALEAAGVNTLGMQFISLMWNKAIGKKTNLSAYAAFIKKAEEAGAPQEFLDYLMKTVTQDGEGPISEEDLEKKIGALTVKGLTDESTAAGKYDEIWEAMQAGDTEKAEQLRKAMIRSGSGEETVANGINKAGVRALSGGAEKAEDAAVYYVQAMKAGNKADAKKLLDQMRVTWKDADDKIAAALAAEDSIRAAASGRKRGDESAYRRALAQYKNFGFDEDTIDKAVTKAENKISGSAKEQLQSVAGSTDQDECAAKWVSLMVKGKRSEAAKLTELMGTAWKTSEDAMSRALSKENDIIKAAKARKEKDDRTYQAILAKWRGYGFDDDLVIKAINKAYNALPK